MKKLDVNPKCRFHVDSEEWLHLWDGHTGVAFPPDEVAALIKFLAPEIPNPKLEEGNDGQ